MHGRKRWQIISDAVRKKPLVTVRELILVTRVPPAQNRFLITSFRLVRRKPHLGSMSLEHRSGDPPWDFVQLIRSAVGPVF